MQTNTESNRTATIVERKTISIMKACELVGVSRRTIYNWIASGKIEYVRTAGGSVRIFVDTLWREPARRRPGAQRSFMNQDFGLLFHRLNNQLGIILANAELLEAKLAEDAARARASLGRDERPRSDVDRPRNPAPPEGCRESRFLTSRQ